MKNEFTPYDRSLKLKQLGFEDECMAYYEISVTEVEHEEDGTSGPFGWKQGEVSFEKRFFKNNIQGIDCSNENWLEVGAPLFQQAFRWFREKYNLHSLIGIYPNTKEWYSSYQDLNWSGKETLDFNKTEDRSIRFKTYEEAELACLDKLIEIVESKQNK